MKNKMINIFTQKLFNRKGGNRFFSRIAFVFPIVGLALMMLAFSVADLQDSQQKRRQRKKQQAPPLVFQTNAEGKGIALEVVFTKGKNHNHPLMAIWVEDMDGKYIQTLYVAESIGKGVFGHGDPSTGKWLPGPIRRPAALPYWGHQRGIQAPDGFFLPTQDNPAPDAYTGATPKGNFVLQTKSDQTLKYPFRVLMEINQSWDWNPYWTNNKFPDDEHYKTSSQPAVVYEAIVNPSNGQREFEMKAIGRSHHSGKDGKLYTDLETLTTALKIAEKVIVKILE